MATRLKPLVVFAGRSNVGKSSTIRALTGKKVRVGKRPGSTRWEQMFDMGSVTFVDIPGFGYMAGTSKQSIDEMKTAIVQKLEGWSERLVLAILILDLSLFRELVVRWESRNEIPIDVEFYSFLSEISPNVLVAANKIDKLKKRQVPQELDYLQLKLRETVPEQVPLIVPVSASKRKNVKRLKETIDGIIVAEGLTSPSW